MNTYLTIVCSTEQTKEDGTITIHRSADFALDISNTVSGDSQLVRLVPPNEIC